MLGALGERRLGVVYKEISALGINSSSAVRGVLSRPPAAIIRGFYWPPTFFEAVLIKPSESKELRYVL